MRIFLGDIMVGMVDDEAGLPGRAGVVVVGGGVMGCSTLYHLAARGVGDAVLLERNRLTSGTTWHSAAQVRALRSSRNLTKLIQYSIDLYARLEEETGQACGWLRTGSLSLACNKDRLVHIRRQAALAEAFGVRASEVSAGEAKARWRLMNADDVLAAVWSPDDGRVNPSDLCAALVRGARARGAQVFEQTAVTGIATRGGRVVGVETAAGLLRCDAVAVCAGLWSDAVARMGGAAAPLWACEHFYLLTQPLPALAAHLPAGEHLPTLSDHDSHLYCRDETGGLLIGCFEPRGKPLAPAQLGEDFAFGLLPEDWAHFEPMMQNALARIPALADAQVKMLLNGPESFTPDGMFLLGETPQTRGLFLGCGMNSVGVATGGGGGYALAQCIVRGHLPDALPEADPARFAPCFWSAAALAARAPEVLGRHYEIAYPARQPQTARNLRQTPLHAVWEKYGAQFGQFYGFERALYFGKDGAPSQLTFARPAWFAQVADEVQNAHAGAAVFDSSTLGKIAVEGRDAEAFLNRVCANDMTRAAGAIIYTAMLNARGGVESDLTAMRLSATRYRLTTGTAAVARDLAWLQCQRLPHEQVALRDETEQWAVLALCGAQAACVAKSVAEGGAAAWLALPFFHWTAARVAGCAVQVARLSYVGEMGWEITCRWEDAAAVAAALLQAGAKPAGVFAQTAMRIEKGFVAYGHDIDADVLPLEANLPLDWTSDFIGREALAAARKQAADDAHPTTHRIVTLVAEDANLPYALIGGEPVLAEGEIIGQTTSAAYGYRLRRYVAIARVRTAPLAAAGWRATVNLAGQSVRVRAVCGAAFDPKHRRLKFS